MTANEEKKMTAEKLDVYREHKADYASPKKPTLLEISPAKYLTIDGQGRPGGEAFQDAIGALYAGAFTMKMASKSEGRDYTVCKLEALWWCDGVSFEEASPDQMRYKLMIRTPDFVTGSDLKATQRILSEKGKTERGGDLKLETLKEGKCVQVLHVGPYEREGETVALLGEFASAHGLAFHGTHHEIYLSDPRRVEPERLKTIVRHPVRPA